jgi:hypothetical protein
MGKVVEDPHYKFRVDFPGVVSDKVEDFDGKAGALAWRLYTSSSPESQRDVAYTAAVKVFDTDTTDVRQLFAAGENDATQSLGATLVGRKDGEFGDDKLPCITLSYQSGGDAAAGPLKGTVLLVVTGKRLYEVTFSFRGVDQTTIGTKFFQSFQILK